MTEKDILMRQWRVVGYCAFVGIIVGILSITAFLPGTILAFRGIDFMQIGVHCHSFKMIAHWVMGIGGCTVFVYFIAAVSLLKRKKYFTIFSLFIVILHLMGSIAIMVFGLIETKTRKEFVRNVWNEFNETTTHLVQNHFSCCDFEFTNHQNPKEASCYAIEEQNITWPNGCYERVMTLLPGSVIVKNLYNENVTVAPATGNPFIASYLVFFIMHVCTDGIAITGFALLLKNTNFKRIRNIATYKHLMKEDSRNTTQITIIYKGNASKSNISIHDLEEKPEPDDRSTTPSSVSIQPSTDKESLNILERLSHVIIDSMESFFFWLGLVVGRNPKITIILSSIATVAMSLGLFQMHDLKNNPEKLLPGELPIMENFKTVLTHFPMLEQYHQMLVYNDDGSVLDAETLRKTLLLDKSIKAINSSTGTTFDSACLKYTAGCGQESLLEMWSYDEKAINELSDQDIIQTIRPKNLLISPYYGGKYDIEDVLGGTNLEQNGEISLAKAHLLTYTTRVLVGGGDWQDQFIKLGRSKPHGLNVVVQASNSYFDENQNSYLAELPLLFAGFVLVFLYISAMTGKFSHVRNRVVMGGIGVMSAGMALGSGIGLSCAFHFDWYALHLVTPFLIMGIGVDDMFVLLQMWNVIDEDHRFKHLSVDVKAAHVLKAAGTSITVTSITDMVAFAIGATSELPILKSFAAYTSFCIVTLFGLQCTFFLAVTVLDQRRREKQHNACIWWHKHGENYTEGKCANREIFQWIFENVIGWALEFAWVRIVVILATLGLTGLMGWAFYNLRVEYNPDWYLPSDSYVLDFIEKQDHYFNHGEGSEVFLVGIDFYENRDKIRSMYGLLQDNQGVDNNYLESWFHDYENWSEKVSNPTTTQFHNDVKKFLMTTGEGNRHLYDVVFHPTLGHIIASKFQFRHVVVEAVLNDVEIMVDVQNDIESLGFNSSQGFVFTYKYFLFELTRIINAEAYRNIGITLACVFVITLPTLASIRMSLMVGVCIVITIVDVAGTMYFAGLYIETSTVVCLLITVGLAVDYAAHIGHKFLTLKGSRVLRMRVALSQVGPAVFNGGFSTFLALVFLAGSPTYTYKVFFTILTCVVAFGLWNGLLFLPSLLGFIGPPPHASAHQAHLSKRAKIRSGSSVAVNPKAPDSQEIRRS